MRNELRARQEGAVARAGRRYRLDVRDPEGWRAALGAMEARWGGIDVLFNVAGYLQPGYAAEIALADVDRTFDINVKGVLNGIAAALPVMEAQGSGHIINTASTAAHAIGGAFAVYCGSKYAVRAITEGLRQEMNAIRVTLITPGVTESELGHDITDQGTAQAVQQIRTIALPANAIARAVLYAISQPDDVDVNEIIVRTVRSAGHAF